MSTMGKGARTRAEILAVGLQVWRERGMERVTCTHVASLVGVTHATCLYHFKTTEGLRNAIAAEAVRQRDSIIVPQLITTNHIAVMGMSDAMKRVYFANL